MMGAGDSGGGAGADGVGCGEAVLEGRRDGMLLTGRVSGSVSGGAGVEVCLRRGDPLSCSCWSRSCSRFKADWRLC